MIEASILIFIVILIISTMIAMFVSIEIIISNRKDWLKETCVLWGSVIVAWSIYCSFVYLLFNFESLI